MKRIVGSLLIISTVLFSACVTESKTSEVPQKPFIVYNIDSIPKDLLMLNKRPESEKDLLNALFEGLVAMDKYGEIVPAIAESWEISEDKLEYRFLIRDNATWSDGNDIKAQDFVDFFAEILNKKVENIFYNQLTCIYGVEDYHSGKVGANGLAIKADGEKNLTVRLNYPYTDFLKVLSQPIYGLRNNTSELNNWKREYNKIKYSGPFVVEDINEDNSVVLSNNKYYWNKEEITKSKFIISEKSSKESALAEFEASSIDIITDPPISEVGRLIESDNTVIVNTSNKIGIVFNFAEKSVAADRNFRMAISKSIDSGSIAENALSEYKLSKDDKFGESVNVFKSTAAVSTRDANEAKEYISRISPEKLKNIRLIALNTDKNKRISKAVQESIKSELNIDIKVSLVESYELAESISNKSFDILLADFPVDYDEDISLLERWNSKSIDNYGKYSSEIYDSAFVKVRLEQDNSIRRNYIEECKKIIREDLPFVYLFNDVKIISKSHDISGLDVNIFGNLDFKSVSRNK